MANFILNARLLLVILAVLTLPGYALLAVSPLWRQWQGVQKLIVALAIGTALYPVGFYALGLLPASFTLGPVQIGFFLLLCTVFIAWRTWREPAPAFQDSEWIGLLVILLTLLTRWYVADQQPYPAWTDSLHHTILTQLIADHGRLPATLDPYFPVPLGMYHLGLHAIAAVIMGLAKVPAHTALLWTAQTLNGLCGIGVYFVLDRWVSRTAALVGAVAVGLLCYQPAFYVNWGRYTQVSSQTILFVAWAVVQETVEAWPILWRNPQRRSQKIWLTVLAALFSAAVFLLHFRVASMYIFLLVVALGASFWRLRRDKVAVGWAVMGVMSIGVLALLFVSPALWEALRIYVKLNLTPIPAKLATVAQIAEVNKAYYEFDWVSIELASRTWLLVVAAVAAVIGLVRLNKVTLMTVAWVGLLYLLGTAYVWGISLLNVTNLGAILIMLYLPMGLVIGAGAEEVVRLFKPPWRERVAWGAVGAALILGLLALPTRITDLEQYRYFVTPDDVAAMNWIKANTPQDALFAINTHFWIPALPHGTDAGYWIPYLTGRKITAGVMLLNLADYDYQIKILELSRAEKRLETDLTALDDLQAQGVSYVYIGERGNFDGSGLKVEQLKQSPKLALVYQKGNVCIFHLKPH